MEVAAQLKLNTEMMVQSIMHTSVFVFAAILVIGVIA